jgi:hypothetical protein
MDQSRLIDESEDDVWEATIIFLGGYKKVSGWLWPGLAPKTAYAKLKNCFRDEKDERLTWEERKLIMSRAREAGCHMPMYRLCGDLLYEQPAPASKDRLKQEIATQINVNAERLHALLDRFQQLEDD